MGATYSRGGVVTATVAACFAGLMIGIAIGRGAIPALDAVQQWQTLLAALVALTAAFMAWKSTTRQIKHAASIDEQRRSRKHDALRAVLPLALSSVSSYASHCDECLDHLHRQCVDELLPRTVVDPPEFPDLPTDAIDTIKEFIEYSGTIDVNLFQKLLARIQIHHARLRTLLATVRKQDESHRVSQHTLETYIRNGAEIHAGAAAAFDYGRKRTDVLPHVVTWDDVRSALNNLRLGDRDDIAQVYSIIDQLATGSTGPS